MDPWSGQMAFPGGWKSKLDPTLEAVARREAAEEIGLPLAVHNLIGRLDDIEGERLRLLELTVSPFVYFVARLPALQLNHEVAATVSVPLHWLAQQENLRPYYFPLDHQHRAFASYTYGPYTVWGLTYRIIVKLLALFDIQLPGGDEEPFLDPTS